MDIDPRPRTKYIVATLTLVTFIILISSISNSAVSAEQRRSITSQERYETLPFSPGSLIIPMDEKQNDRLQAFGMLHALLRNETICYRLIGPPATFIKTLTYSNGSDYAGGPIILVEYNITLLAGIITQFSEVT